MSRRVALVSSVLGPASEEAEAERALETARADGVEILDYLSHRTGMGEDWVFERAARFCGLGFSNVIPDAPRGVPRISQVDRLGGVRCVRERVIDRDVLFVSPDARTMLTLGAAYAMGGRRDLICVVPPRVLRERLMRTSAQLLLAEARQRLARRWPFASAHLDLTIRTRMTFIMALLLVVMLAAIAPFWLEPVLVPFLVILFLLPAILKLFAVFDSGDRGQIEAPPLTDRELPVYSVLLPLRDEAGMVPQLARAMRALDYPPEKLDIKFVAESASTRTVQAVRRELGDPRFELIIVPQQPPLTKPKALNYALPMVRGSHVVVYDAEDVPEPDQLRRAAARFAFDDEVECIQAELVIDNAEENWLTALFSAEYSGLFGLMLPALARWNLPVPLGGTSNHFRLSALRRIGGWDAFNVTEDADLGVRLSRLRFGVATMQSKTYEEAPVTLKAWLQQRTRWMKGWMQTFIVHNRYWRDFLRDAGWRNFIAFQVHVGGMIVSAPLHLVFTLALTIRFTTGRDLGFTPHDDWAAAHLFILLIGVLGAASLSFAGMARQRRGWLLFALLLLPVYWGLIGLAALRACNELLTRPYFWAKTRHGVSRKQRHAEASATALTGMERVKGIEPSS